MSNSELDVKHAKQLLNDVSEKLKNFEESQKESGELFNIFSITKIERREVDTHSAMIAELLKPQGRHGQGDKFLIEFLKIVMPTHQFTGMKQAKISKEKSFDDSRIDILIELDNHVFVIENKIDADDGDKQLQRYKEILDTYFNDKKGHLIYLTKYGAEAEKYSLGTVKDDEYQRISYKNHILNWLITCINEVNHLPKVKYALEQYQDLIKKITGQSMTHELKNDLTAILMEGDNLKSAQEISKIIWKVQGKILFDFFEKLKIEFGHVSISKLNEYNKEKCELWFHPNSRTKQNDIGFCFDVGSPNFLFRIEAAMHALHYGVVPITKLNDKYEFDNNSKILLSPFNTFQNGRKWASEIHRVENSASVFNDANLIRDENEQKFIAEVKNAIYVLKKESE